MHKQQQIVNGTFTDVFHHPIRPVWNYQMERYEFQMEHGTLCVHGDVFSEQEKQGVDVSDWTLWDNCIDGETIYYV